MPVSKSTLLAPLRLLVPDRASLFCIRLLTRRLARELAGQATDKLVELLLYAMSLAFLLVKSYRDNIRGYEAVLVFRSASGPVAAAARFKSQSLSVDSNPQYPGDVQISFQTPLAFRRFLLAKDHDVLDSMLNNEVEVVGNVNHVYRFGFLANELLLALRIDPP